MDLFKIAEKCIIYPILGVSCGPLLGREAFFSDEVPNLQPLIHSRGSSEREKLFVVLTFFCCKNYCAVPSGPPFIP